MPGLNLQIVLASLLGLLGGWLTGSLPEDSGLREGLLYGSELAGGLFTGLLKMLLVPLVFTSVTLGVASLQAHRQIRRVWMAALFCFLLTTVLAIAEALLFSSLFQPGHGLSLAMFAMDMDSFQTSQLSLSGFFRQLVAGLFQNPFAAFASNNLMAVVVFALFIGAGLVAGRGRYQRLEQLLQDFMDLLMQMLGWIMRLAPLGILALLLRLVALQEPALLSALAGFVLLVLGLTLFHGLLVLPGLLFLLAGRSPWRFFRGVWEALLMALATSSSAATLPVSLQCAGQQLGVRPAVAHFVLPLGATMNMDGTALYEAVAALFVAQLAGAELGYGQQLVMFLMVMLASVGAPGIPSAGMVTMMMVLQSVGLPVEAVAILLPVDRLLDTLRTAVNVEGDLVCCLMVQRLAGSGGEAVPGGTAR